MKFGKLLDYTNVTVTKIEPAGIRVIPESGSAKIAAQFLLEVRKLIEQPALMLP